MTEFSPLPQHQSRQSVSRTLSTSSIHSIAASLLSNTSSLSLPLLDDVEVVTQEGLRHAPNKLDARKYKTSHFQHQLLDTIHALKVPSWSHSMITPVSLKVDKVSGSLTNAVFFISCPSVPGVRTLLLRIYGNSSGSLISRPRELHTLHMLSSKYQIGPKVYGTFENGRIEEYFDSTTLTASDLRDEKISQWIGARMAELHSVDIDIVEKDDRIPGDGYEIGAKKNVLSWMEPAEATLNHPNLPDHVRKAIDLPRFKKEWTLYMQQLARVDDAKSASRRVFAHNDTQYGNLLRLKTLKEGAPEHRQIIVVDFEYACPNPASFDIANHFHEWTANYHGNTPHLLDPSLYPTGKQRRNFYKAYLQHSSIHVTEEVLERLEKQVRVWSPASHAMWAIWGLVQAREDVEGNVAEPEFDYVGYSRGRMEAFYKELKELRASSLI